MTDPAGTGMPGDGWGLSTVSSEEFAGPGPAPATSDATRLGVDFGTSHTVAAFGRPGGRTEALLFDSSPLLPSAVCLSTDGDLRTGRDAERSARLDPSAFEPHPKRRIDDGALLLGGRDVPVVEAIAAVLRRVADEANRALGAAPAATILTHPTGWGPQRRAVLTDAAQRAGLPAAELVAEPVAAAMYFTGVLGHHVPDGHAVVVYDFGGGTFDISVVRRRGDAWDVVAAQGLDDVGGIDLDAAIVDWIGRAVPSGDRTLWHRLEQPAGTADRRHRRNLWDDARSVKELLSRVTTAGIAVPLFDVDLHLTRAEFEALARPWLDRTVALTTTTLFSSGVTTDRLAGVFLVGGGSRVPLVATLLHRALGVAPIILEQPELVVAHGSLLTRPGAAFAVSTAPAPQPRQPFAAESSPRPDATVPVAAAAHEPTTAVLPTAADPVAAAASGPPRAPTSVLGEDEDAGTAESAAAQASDLPTAATVPPVAEPGAVAGQAPTTTPDPVTTEDGFAAADSAAESEPDETTAPPVSDGPTTPVPVDGVSAETGAGTTGELPLGSGRPAHVVVDGHPAGRTSDGGTAAADPRRGGRRRVIAAAFVAVLLVIAGSVWLGLRDDESPDSGSSSEGRPASVTDGAVGEASKGVGVGDSTPAPFVTPTVSPARTLTGHTDFVTRIAFSPDSSRLATAGYDKAVRIWDVTSGQTVMTLTGHGKEVVNVAYNPKGATIATASWDKTVRIWDLTSGRTVTTLNLVDQAEGLAFSPDGATLATSSWPKGENSKDYTNTVRLWDVATGKPKLSLPGLTSHVHSLAFNADGSVLATANYDNTVRLWDLTTGRNTETLTGHTDVVVRLAFSADGHRLATASADQTARIWEVTAGTPAVVPLPPTNSPAGPTGPVVLRGHTGDVNSVAFSPDGRTVATGGNDYTVRLWNAATGASAGTVTGHTNSVESVAFSPDGKLLATGSVDHTARLWSVTY